MYIRHTPFNCLEVQMLIATKCSGDGSSHQRHHIPDWAWSCHRPYIMMQGVHLRCTILDRLDVLLKLDNEKKFFDGLEHNSKFDVIVIGGRQQSKSFQAAFFKNAPINAVEQPRQNLLTMRTFTGSFGQPNHTLRTRTIHTTRRECVDADLRG